MWYRHVSALGGVFNILMMMTANLVGFVIGTEGVSYLLNRMLSGWEGNYSNREGLAKLD